MSAMRDLTPNDLGVLLSVFAVLLLAFGADFHFSRRIAKRHKLSARIFMTVNVVGELATAVALVLTWVACGVRPPGNGSTTSWSSDRARWRCCVS